MAYLTDEAALRAQVTVEHVVGGVLQQRDQVAHILIVRYLGKKACINVFPGDGHSDAVNSAGYLSQVHDAVQVARLQRVRPLLHSNGGVQSTRLKCVEVKYDGM